MFSSGPCRCNYFRFLYTFSVFYARQYPSTRAEGYRQNRSFSSVPTHRTGGVLTLCGRMPGYWRFFMAFLRSLPSWRPESSEPSLIRLSLVPNLPPSPRTFSIVPIVRPSGLMRLASRIQSPLSKIVRISTLRIYGVLRLIIRYGVWPIPLLKISHQRASLRVFMEGKR